MDNTCVVCGDIIPEGRQVCSICANAAPRSMASEPQREPLWCENCAHFCNADMGGEGECAVDHLPTWYGNTACHKFERGWISVKDAMPEDKMLPGKRISTIKVLVAIKNKNGYCVRSQTRMLGKYWSTRDKWSWGKEYSGEITHWMPLPEPPPVRLTRTN